MDTDSHCNTFPLHEAVVSGYFETVKSLIENGYCVNTMHYDRVTPLHMACLKGNIQIVCYLIKKGAWVNVQSIDNSTPLCDASAGGNIECVKILLEAGAWVNPPLLLSTPLHEASLRGNAEIVSLLIKAGAVINSSDLHYGTPLHAVCSMREPNVECIRTLLKAGAKVNAIKIHKTPLHLIALNSQCVEGAKVLLSYGANVYQKDLNGRKPRQLCDPNSDLALFLLLCETQPKSLKLCCRLAIIKHLGASSLKCLASLPIPSLILRYLE
ncbi:UNVERIFIED_CONTAM: hypothetical protein RMT77_011226 [Armadillidium vulgare]